MDVGVPVGRFSMTSLVTLQVGSYSCLPKGVRECDTNPYQFHEGTDRDYTIVCVWGVCENVGTGNAV